MPRRKPYYFDADKAEAAVEFFPRFLCLVDGEWAGKPFKLSPFQAEDTRQIFGWRKTKDGTRRYRFARIWIPRKNGKTTWCAGFAHLLTVGDGEPGAQVFSHALDAAQASLVFDVASKMAVLSPALSQLYEISKVGLFCPALMSSFRWLSGEAYGKHGLSPHGNIGDEAHAWRNGKLHTFLIQGMGARRQPLDITISTAGEIKTYGHQLYETCVAIKKDPELDPETYVSIYEADQDDDWTDPAVWKKANPNLGVSPKIDFMEAECRRAVQQTRLENDFKRYHLNMWVEQTTRWFPMKKWAANTADPKNRKLWQSLPQAMIGKRRANVCVGVDLGSTSDITAAVWVFPGETDDDRITLIPRFWVPEDTVAARDNPRTPYKKWVADGALLTTPGNVTDYDYIEASVQHDAKMFGCSGVAYDPWNATQFAIHLQEEGLPCVEFRQGYASMGEPSKELERLFLKGQLEHGNHPVLEWMFGNATYRKDPAGNIKPDKERAIEKIDGVVASVMALGLANTIAEKKYQVLIFA